MKIYDDAKDKNVATNVLYLGTDDKYYKTAADATAMKAGTDVTGDEAVDLFLKGVVLFTDDTYYAAISCTDEGAITFAIPEEEEEDGGSDPQPGA